MKRPLGSYNREMHDRPIRLGRFWWIPVVRGVFSLLLGTAVLVTQGNRAMLANFIGVYWLLSGFLTLRLALTVRWLRGSRIGLAAGSVSVTAAVLVLLRQQLQHLISANTLINVLGVAAFSRGPCVCSERSRSSDGRGGAGPSEVSPSDPSR